MGQFSLHSFPRAILHIDGDSFFASCEVAKNPRLKGKPVVVGKERGMATALTYEAKAKGVTRGMTIRDVIKICPDAVILPSDYETYSLYSKRMFSIVRRYTPVVEEYSIDECFAELTGMRRSLRMPYERMAENIKRDLDSELGMTFSVGLAPTKVLAKVASKWKKPSGLTILPARKIHLFLEKLPVEKIWGVGPQTQAFLNAQGVRTALEYAEKPEEWVRVKLTKPHYEIWKELRGEFVYELNTEEKHDYQSISKTKTFTPPSSIKEYVFAQLSKNIENACIKARRHRLAAKEIFFFLKTQSFDYRGLEIKLSRSTDIPTEIIEVIREKFDYIFKDSTLYRSTGIVLMRLVANSTFQPDLFGQTLKADHLKDVYKRVDTMDAKYGKHTVFLGSSFKAVTRTAHNTDRGEKAERVNTLFKGETVRKRLGIPMLGNAI